MQSDMINKNAACRTTDVGNEMAVNGKFEETRMSTTASDEPKLFFPGLAGFYASVSDLWYPMIRVGIGAILFVHGWGKLNGGVADVTSNFAKNGFAPASSFAFVLETIGRFASARSVHPVLCDGINYRERQNFSKLKRQPSYDKPYECFFKEAGYRVHIMAIQFMQ